MSMAVIGGSDRPAQLGQDMMQTCLISYCISPVSWTIITLPGFLAA